MNEPILSARGLRKAYRSGDGRIEVLRAIDLDVASGESVSVRGESGSGKSTLLNLLAGLDAPDAGAVAWAGSPQLGAARRGAFLGMIFQAYHLVPEIDARANVLLARRFIGRIDAAARRRADELLERVGLPARARHLPSQLSGGERQRVAVARALMNSPRLLLADEPTGNLDEATGETVIELLLNLAREQGAALVLVTHNAAHAEKTDRHLRLHEGALHDARQG